MKPKEFSIFLLSVALFPSVGCSSRTIDLSSFSNFCVTGYESEIVVEGMLGESSAAVGKPTTNTDSGSLSIYFDRALPSDTNSASFKYRIEIGSDIDSVTYLGRGEELWNRSIPLGEQRCYRFGELNK